MPRELTPDERAQVESLARAGRKIDAIKLHRETTGSSLLEAKNAVEEIVPPPQAAGDRWSLVRKVSWSVFAVALVVWIAMTIYIQVKLGGRNLEVVNAGAAPLTVRHGSDTFVAEPGKSWKLEAGPGDHLVITQRIDSSSTSNASGSRQLTSFERAMALPRSDERATAAG
jgi:hypothetical protein